MVDAGERGGDAIVTVLWHLSPRIFGRMPYIVPHVNFTSERDFLDMSMNGGCGITHQYYKREPQYDFGKDRHEARSVRHQNVYNRSFCTTFAICTAKAHTCERT